MFDPFLMHPPNPPPRKLAFPLSVLLRVLIDRMTCQSQRHTRPTARTPTRPLGEGPDARGFPRPPRDGWEMIVWVHGRMNVIFRGVRSRIIRHERPV